MKKETKKYGTILRIFQRTKFLEELKWKLKQLEKLAYLWDIFMRRNTYITHGKENKT